MLVDLKIMKKKYANKKIFTQFGSVVLDKLE